VFCVGVIHNVWSRKDRLKSYANGSTHPLTELSNSTVSIGNERAERMLSEDLIQDQGEDYDCGIDLKLDAVKKIIDQEKNSNDKAKAYKAKVFYYSHYKFKNPRQFSIHSKIPYNAVLEAHNAMRIIIKDRLCRLSL
jgi:hypothetical protein